jgi:DNA replication protein DnaC
MPSSTVLNAELVVALKRLKLGRIADTLPERLVLADKQEMTFDDLLLLILTDEIARRDNTAADLRASEARLDPAMRLETWDKTSKVSFDKRMLAELTSLRFLEAHRHVVVLGPVGVGKTFVSQALGHIACRHGYHVRFTRADEMLRTLRQSRLDNSRDAEMIALTSVDMLIVDDFALEPMSKEESRDVYQLFLERTGRGSMIVTSNRDTAEWLAMFDDVLLAQSAVDRFKNAAYDFVMEGESYRSRLKPKLDSADPPQPLRRTSRGPTRAHGDDADSPYRPDVTFCGRVRSSGCMTLQNCPGLGMFRTRKMKIDIETEKGHFHSGRSTRPSGCMTLQIGWLHGGANWQEVPCSPNAARTPWPNTLAWIRPHAWPMAECRSRTTASGGSPAYSSATARQGRRPPFDCSRQNRVVGRACRGHAIAERA